MFWEISNGTNNRKINFLNLACENTSMWKEIKFYVRVDVLGVFDIDVWRFERYHNYKFYPMSPFPSERYHTQYLHSPCVLVHLYKHGIHTIEDGWTVGPLTLRNKLGKSLPPVSVFSGSIKSSRVGAQSGIRIDF